MIRSALAPWALSALLLASLGGHLWQWRAAAVAAAEARAACDARLAAAIAAGQAAQQALRDQQARALAEARAAHARALAEAEARHHAAAEARLGAWRRARAADPAPVACRASPAQLAAIEAALQ